MQTNEQLKQHPLASREELADALQTATALVRENVETFYDCFPAANSENNFYPKSVNVDWTTGFWTGEVWLSYEHTKDEKLKSAALVQIDSFLDRIIKRVNVDHHDMGFLYSPSCVAGYKLAGSENGKKAAIMAADNLLGRFHESGEFFQAWGSLDDDSNYRLIIDCLLNMPILFWATEVTGDTKYQEKASRHIKTAMKCVVRPDNSTYHTYYIDRQTGKPDRGVTCQGNRDGSVWARGQAWGIYGSAYAYSKLKDEEYLDIFRRVTDYFLTNLPKDLVPYWDFDFTDGSDEPRDSSSAAIAVCGMLEMAKFLPKDEAEYYIDMAKRLMKALIDICAVKNTSESNGLLLHGTYSKKTPTNTCNHGGVDECNTWGDYFYLEALTRLTKDWEMYW